MATPTRLKVTAGSNALNLSKGTVLDVIEVKELGADYSHMVRLVLKTGTRQLSLYARHINRLSDRSFNLNNGDPTKKIEVSPFPV